MDATERAKESREEPTKDPIVDPVYPPGMPGIMQRISDRLKKMTPEEFRESLKRAGIIDADGNLAPQYRTPKKKIRRAPRRKPRSKFL
jgi:hypothetical protein